MPNQPFKFRTKYLAAIRDDLRRTYNTNSRIKLKFAMLISSSCTYNELYILVKGIITITEKTAPLEETSKLLEKRKKVGNN